MMSVSLGLWANIEKFGCHACHGCSSYSARTVAAVADAPNLAFDAH
jgi:hypothetical protein